MKHTPLVQKTGLRAWISAFPLCAGLAAQAADDPAALSLEQLMRVTVVGAAKYEQRLEDVAASVSVITREEIRSQGWRTVDEALASLPGIHLTYDRQYSALGTRGVGLPGDFNTRILLTLNGNRLNDPLYDAAPAGLTVPIDLDLIERIEFIPGPGGAVYGQNAMFAVINLVTRTGASVGGTELVGSYQGPQRTRQVRLGWGGRIGQADVLLSATALRSRGEDRFYDFGGGVAGVASGLDGARDQEFYGRVATGPWSAELLYGKSIKDDPTGVFYSDPLVPGQYQGDSYTALQATYRGDLGRTGLGLEARVFGGAQVYLGRQVFSGVWNQYPGKSQWAGLELRLITQQIRNHKLVFGLEAQDNRRMDQFFIDESDEANNFRISSPGYRAGLYAQDEWQISPTLAATLGWRFDRSNTSRGESSPRLGVIWQATPRSTLKALAGRAHREPTTYERDYDDGGQLANPSLRGETIDTLEFVADHRVDSGLVLRASAYHWRMRDIITLTLVDEVAGTTRFQSGGTVRADGLELSATQFWRWGGQLRGEMSLQKVRDAVGLELPNSPRRKVSAHFTAPLPWRGVRMGASWRAESGRLDAFGQRLGGYAVADLNVRAVDVVPNLELMLTVRNLLDKRYTYPTDGSLWLSEVEQDGRSWQLQARLKF
jgi:iron complex outermembrane receptor protein